MKFFDKILDASIYFSFDQRGYKRHQSKYFSKEDYIFSSGDHALITGGTSGIGKSVAESLIHFGVNCCVTGRSKEKGDNFAATNPLLLFKAFDLANWSDISNEIKDLSPLDYIVLNAGAMPDNFKANAEGIEFQAASQFFGHYYLLIALERKGLLKKDCRIVWVSSGGMYLKSFERNEFFDADSYDKVSAYSNVKRAQVEYLKKCSREFSSSLVMGMHPGWVETPGLQGALPKFTSHLGNNLRTVEQGADTIIWLLGTKSVLKSGEFYFDRKIANKNFSLLPKSSPENEKILSELLKENLPF